MTQTPMTLSPAEKKALKAQAHALNPVVLIGDKGLTSNVLKEIDMNLTAHGLIKVRIAGDDRDERLSYAETICTETQSALVQHIGKLLVLYRPQPEELKAKQNKPTPKRKEARTTKRQHNAKD